MVTISMRDAVAPYVTRDGSEIRELMHPGVQGNVTQSLAEATVAPGATTHLHRHHRSEELYHITRGNGVMVLGDERIAIHPGDTVLIPPGMAHCVENTGTEPLVILCACSPPYAHEDTELINTN